jgi:hypothetical protein
MLRLMNEKRCVQNTSDFDRKWGAKLADATWRKQKAARSNRNPVLFQNVYNPSFHKCTPLPSMLHDATQPDAET